MKIDVWHTVLWSKYKGSVFSSLYSISKETDLEFRFVQIAKTDNFRISLTDVDLTYHTYPYALLFPGVYDDVSALSRIWVVMRYVIGSDARLVLLPGYHKVEYWAMLGVALLMRKRCGLFSDSTAYDRPRVLWKTILKRIFMSRCDVVFCYGQRAAAYVHSFGVPYEKIVLRCQAAALPHGYSEELAMRERALRSSKAVPEFLYVGRLAPEKDLEVLISAFANVRSGLPTAKLTIVGDGPLRDALTKQTRELRLDDAVTFVGSLDIGQIAPLYKRAACLVLPSVSEPWGLVVNESLSYGCPVVASDSCGCVPELIKEGVTGFTFETGNVSSLVKQLLAVPVQFADAEGTARRCLEVIREFTPERAAEQIFNGCKLIQSNSRTR